MRLSIKIFASILAAVLAFQELQASVSNNGAKIVVPENASVRISGSGAKGAFINRTKGLHDGEITLSGNLYVEGDIANEAGNGENFNLSGNGTVHLIGTGQEISGRNTFPNLYKSVSGSDTLRFGAGIANSTSILGTLTLKGASGTAYLYLRSSEPDSQWLIAPAGNRDLAYLDVKDSNNVSGSLIIVSSAGCKDSGNNTNWVFADIDLYTVSFRAGEHGSINGAALQAVIPGGDCSPVTAHPDPGYHFAGWTGDYEGTENPLVIENVTKDMTIDASFEANPPGQYTVTFLAGEGGSIDGVASQLVEDGGTCSAVTAKALPGYEFSAWSGDHSGTENPLVVSNVTKDMNIAANFSMKKCTVVFTAAPGGVLDGELVQTVAYGGDCSPVSPVPDEGYHFNGWTGSYEGNTVPLTIKNVTQDMEIFAGFAVNPAGFHAVTFIAASNGRISGTATQYVQSGGNCIPVVAVPEYGFHFTGWTGDYDGSDNPLSIANVTKNMLITGNFAENEAGQFTVTFDPGQNGTIQGAASQIVSSGESTSEVTAVPDPGYFFFGWTGDYSGDENPVAISNVVSDMIISADFEIPTNCVAFGMIYQLEPDEVENYPLKNFTSKPSVTAYYTDPVTAKKDCRAGMKLMNKISSKEAAEHADLEWIRKVKLVDLKLWDKKKTCQQNINDNYGGEIPSLACSLKTKMKYKDDKGAVVQLKDAASGTAILMPPSISKVLNLDGAVIHSAGTDETFQLEGYFFGKSVPSVWLEFLNDKGVVKTLRLKVLKPYEYPDYKKKTGKSCMDIATGESSISVQTPKKWPKTWNNDLPHNIVIDNKVGRTTVPFQTQD